MSKLKIYYFFYAFLFLFYAINLAKPIDLTTQDLGRHIANGREIVSGNLAVLSQNFYSYTLPENKFINHHWLFGLITFFLEHAVGFIGIHVFNILVLITAFWFFLKITVKETSHFYGLLIGLPAVLFLSLRAEVRPESIGLLFMAHTLYQLQTVIQKKQVTTKQLILLTIQQLFWVNIHISFIFGIFIIGLLWISSFILHSPDLDNTINKKLSILFVSVMVASIANPNFLMGALQPLLIFTDYGYAIVENQTLYSLWRILNLTTVFPFLLVVAIGLALLVFEKKVLSWFEILLYLTGFFLGFYALRNIPIFVVFSLPILTKLAWSCVQKSQYLSKIKLSTTQKTVLLAQLYLFVIAVSLSGKIMPRTALANRKLGLLPNQNQATEFIKANNLHGPIFNNYDLGSYLIYHHPDIKVFTDNRPEAYNKKFFQKIYIPMQTDPEVWLEQLQKYRFQTIIFGVRDLTPAAHKFLQFISDHPDWQLSFQDEFIKIWVYKSADV